MISRRAFVGTGVVAVALAGVGVVAETTHRLDNFARAVGVKPRPRPVASDDRLIAAVAGDQNRVLGAVEATAARHASLAAPLKPFAVIGQAHVEAVGGSAGVPNTGVVDAEPARAARVLAKTYTRASRARAVDAGRAVSPDLARVLSSMSAGLAQCARTVDELR